MKTATPTQGEKYSTRTRLSSSLPASIISENKYYMRCLYCTFEGRCKTLLCYGIRKILSYARDIRQRLEGNKRNALPKSMRRPVIKTSR